MKKQIISAAAALSMALVGTQAALTVSAETAPAAEITVTVANAGELEVAAEPLTVTDTDGDGALTVNDALYLIHEAKYEGGAAAGYAAAESQWGLSITKLWGVENGGSFGYTVNNAFANGLTDAVKTGDSLYAYVYKDTAGYSDIYTFFDSAEAEAEASSAVTLTLKGLVFADGAMTEQPVEGAALTLNGQRTDSITGKDGTVSISIDEAGDYLISAQSDLQTIVPPVTRLKVNPPETAVSSVDVTVTVADAGELKTVQEPVTVTDTDGDGKLTINDALYLIHEAKYEGGAAAGYAAAESQWGLGITKLWGNENGGSFGYTVNNAFANGLTDEIGNGDAIYAYTFKDAAGCSDVYTYFTSDHAQTEEGSPVMLTLKALAFDPEAGAMTEKRVGGAVITLNGKATEFQTGEDGMVRIAVLEAGDYTVSAQSDTETLVPPVMKLRVNAFSDTTGSADQTGETGTSGSSDNSGSGSQNVPAVQAGERAPIAVCVTVLAMFGAAAFVRRKHEK